MFRSHDPFISGGFVGGSTQSLSQGHLRGLRFHVGRERWPWAWQYLVKTQISLDQWEVCVQATWSVWTNERLTLSGTLTRPRPLRLSCPELLACFTIWGWRSSEFCKQRTSSSWPVSRRTHLLFENWVRILSKASHGALSHFPRCHDLKLVVWVSLNSILKHLNFWNEWRWKDDPWDKRDLIFITVHAAVTKFIKTRGA